ncbi:UNVERIFIED_CONTAM: putative ribonuclease H protein [Sesamum calycinum]|uniref:Ribonuclease H protein n=1 Tax=Sesamum calycinum TaxID=2727403 RepID=A0AAW2QZ53_9LAMI
MVSQLAYAENVLIFMNSKERSLKKIMKIFRGYEEASKQLISIGKSSFIVSPKAPVVVKRQIKRVIGFVFKTFPFTYLRAPIYVGKKKIEHFHCLVEGMVTKIRGWEKKFLSYGGHLQMIKSVLMAMPIHLLLVLDPPKGVLLRIERMLMDIVQRVVAIPFDDVGNGKSCWKVNPTGHFSIKTAWELVRDGGTRRPLLKELWHPTVTPSMSIFLRRLLHNFILVDEQLQEKASNPKIIKWLRPIVGWWKLNCDGASKGNPGRAGAGGLIRDCRGRMFLAFAIGLDIQMNVFSKLFVIVKGLQLARDASCTHLYIEIDAKVVLQIIANDTGAWQIQHLLTRLRILHRGIIIVVSHVYREENQLTDYLANQACGLNTILVLTQADSHLASLIRLDNLFPNFRF